MSLQAGYGTSSGGYLARSRVDQTLLILEPQDLAHLPAVHSSAGQMHEAHDGEHHGHHQVPSQHAEHSLAALGHRWSVQQHLR